MCLAILLSIPIFTFPIFEGFEAALFPVNAAEPSSSQQDITQSLLDKAADSEQDSDDDDDNDDDTGNNGSTNIFKGRELKKTIFRSVRSSHIIKCACFFGLVSFDFVSWFDAKHFSVACHFLLAAVGVCGADYYRGGVAWTFVRKRSVSSWLS